MKISYNENDFNKFVIHQRSTAVKKQRGYKTEKNALTRFDGCDIILQWYIEVWLSLVERCVRDAEAVGSSPVTSTK